LSCLLNKLFHSVAMRKVVFMLSYLACVEAARSKPVEAFDAALSAHALAEVNQNAKDTLNPLTPGKGLPAAITSAGGLRHGRVAAGSRSKVFHRHDRLNYRAPVMSMTDDELGKAIQRLNADIPQILRKQPNLSIYTSDFELDLQSPVAFLLMQSLGAGSSKIQGLPQTVGLLQKIRHFRLTKVEWDEVEAKTRLSQDTRGEQVIECNWTAQVELSSAAVTRWVLKALFGEKDESSKFVFSFDAGSRFYVNSEGQIYRCVLDTASVGIDNQFISMGMLEALIFEARDGRAVYQSNRRQALNSLYKDIPQILHALPTMEIYTADVELDFQSPVGVRLLEFSGQKSLSIKGLSQNAEFFGKLQLFGQTKVEWDKFEVLSVEIVHDDDAEPLLDEPDAWNADLDDDIIECKWTGQLVLKPFQLPRPPWVSDSKQIQIDVVSGFYLNAEAKIFRHVIEAVNLTVNDKLIGMQDLDELLLLASGGSNETAGTMAEVQD